MSKVRIFNFAKPLCLLFTLLLLSLFSTATAGAQATVNVSDPESGNPCYDIGQTGTEHFVTGAATFDATGTTGVPNSGVVYFDPPLAPDQQYRACVVDQGTGGQGPFVVKGWAWDDNLGFMSFYCGDEDGNAATPRTNLGVPCGNFDHAVTMEGLNNSLPLERAELSGYAWNDAAGYISFNCNDTGTCGIANHRVWPEGQDSNCLGLVYGNWQPDSTCGANLDTDVFAWSDSIGWFNFENALFPWLELIGVSIDWEFEIRFGSTDALLASSNKIQAPFANGKDEYTVVLKITDSTTGSPLTPAQMANFDINVDLNWTDTVDKIQIDADKDAFFNAIVEPLTINTTLANYDAATGEYRATFTSVAPTSNLNGLDAGGGLIGFLFENFIIPEDGTAPNYPVPKNELIFDGLDLSIEFTPISLCILGGVGTCDPIPDPTIYDGRNIEFKPAVDVTEFNSSMNTDFLSLRNAVADIILVTVADNCNACTGKAASAFLDLVGASEWAFVYDSDNDGFSASDLTSNINLISSGDLRVGATCTNSENVCTAFGQDAYAYTIVSYTLQGKNVQYYSNKLPRVKGTLVVNPVAEFRGNVYSSGVTNPQTGKEVRSLGDISTNLLRNQIWNNVSKIIAGVDYTPPSGDVSITSFNPLSGLQFFPVGSLETLQPDTAGRPRVYFAQGVDVYITGLLGNLVGEQTIIVVDGNVYIEKNIFKSMGDPHELGIIVLKNPSDFGDETTGNIYVGPDVTNIQANMFADGSFFTIHDSGSPIAGNGLPNFLDESNRYNELSNQLYIQGSLASQNTVGGATRGSNPIAGDGEVLSSAEGGYGSAPSGRSLARLYDLNFLRYYGYVFERDPNGDAVDKNGDGQITAAPMPAGDLILRTDGSPADGLDPDDTSAVYFEFDPPSPNLPGFNVTEGAEVTQRAG